MGSMLVSGLLWVVGWCRGCYGLYVGVWVVMGSRLVSGLLWVVWLCRGCSQFQIKQICPRCMHALTCQYILF